MAFLPDELHHAPGGRDADDVQHDGLQGQQQRAERPRQQQEGEHGDEGDHDRKRSVDRLMKSWFCDGWPPTMARGATRRTAVRTSSTSARPAAVELSARAKPLTTSVSPA